jgi:hypothetical protein
MMRIFLVTAAVFFLVTGCTDIMRVQTGYVADRDDCRTSSGSEVDVYAPADTGGMSEKERNTAMLNLFCECMKTKDWKVAGCPKKDKPTEVAAKPAAPVAAAQPTVIVVQAPPQAAPAEEQPEMCPAPNAAPAVHKAYKKRHPKAVCPTSDPHLFDDTDTKTLNNILGNEK